MSYYMEVNGYIISQPKHRVTYCFKCRLIELYQENSDGFQELYTQYHDMFQSYLNNGAVSESDIRNILRKSEFDFKLQTMVYQARKYDIDTFLHDAIGGFTTKQYDCDTRFGLVSGFGQVYNHSVSGYHITGQIRFSCIGDLAYHAEKLINEIDLSIYGEDLMDYCMSYRIGSTTYLRQSLIEMNVECSFETLCRTAETNAGMLEELFITCRNAHGLYQPEQTKRNRDIARYRLHIHPDHRDQGLNLMDILVLLNSDHDIEVIRYMQPMNGNDFLLLMKSLKYWIENVQDEAEYKLIMHHVRHLENCGYMVDLF